MSAPIAAPPEPGPLPEPILPIGPPPEAFWEKYNRWSEFSLAVVFVIAAHFAVAIVLYGIFDQIRAGRKDSGPVQTQFGSVSGIDGDSKGAPGAAAPEETVPLKGTNQPSIVTPVDPTIPRPDTTPQPGAALSNPSGALPPLAGSAFDRTGTPAGNDSGTTTTPRPTTPGNSSTTSGGGGTGTDSDGSGGRWVLNFRYTSEASSRASTVEIRRANGQAFLAQLGGFGGVIVVFKPASAPGPECIVYTDIRRSTTGDGKAEAEVDRLYPIQKPGQPKSAEQWKQFTNDPRAYEQPGERNPEAAQKARDTNEEVALRLGLPFVPERFAARFPPSRDQELAEKEKAFVERVKRETRYKNLRLDDLKKVVFEVDLRAARDPVYVARVLLQDGTVIAADGGRLIIGR